MSDDYINKNHPVSTLSDAAHHCLVKNTSGNRKSIEILTFNFASGTYGKQLTQGLSRSISAFCSFMRQYLDQVVKADQCPQSVDDIGIAANTTTQKIH